jgi:hypothetical protein
VRDNLSGQKVAGVRTAIESASALEAFTPDQCANYLANSGYPHQ